MLPDLLTWRSFAAVAERSTRTVQGRVGETPWRFESSQPHLGGRCTRSAPSKQPSHSLRPAATRVRSRVDLRSRGRQSESGSRARCRARAGPGAAVPDATIRVGSPSSRQSMSTFWACTSAMAASLHIRRDVYRLRIVLDTKYPGIIARALARAAGSRSDRVGRLPPSEHRPRKLVVATLSLRHPIFRHPLDLLSHMRAARPPLDDVRVHGLYLPQSPTSPSSTASLDPSDELTTAPLVRPP